MNVTAKPRPVPEVRNLGARLSFTLAVALLGLETNVAAAADVHFPGVNPPARLSQLIGLTNIVVNYGSPAVAGRPIWRSVAAPGTVWLIGDRAAPTITFSREVVLDGASVPAGTYALLAVPSASDWTVIFNRETKIWRAADRNPALDVAQIRTRAEPAPYRERLAFEFAEFTDQRAILELEWEKVRVRIPIEVETDAQVRSALASLDDVWRRYADAARDTLEKKKDFAAGLTYANQSLALRETWYGSWIKASLLAARGDYARAREEASRAYQLGEAAGDEFTLEPQVKEALAAWNARAAREPAQEPSQEPAKARSRRRHPVRREPGRIATAPSGPQRMTVVDTDLEPFPASAERAVDVARPKASKLPTPAAFSALIKRGSPDLQRCYQRALREDPSLASAKVTLSISVGVSGRVTNVALDPPLTARTLQACVRDAVARWVFPSSPVDYETQVPLVLSGHD